MNTHQLRSRHSTQQNTQGCMTRHRTSRRSIRTCARAAHSLTAEDLHVLKDTAQLSGASAGLTGPHPFSACILVAPDGRRLASAHLRASGATSAELQVVQAAQGLTAGATAYLNLETGDCHGEDIAVRSLIQAGVSRVVVGLRHPLPHARGTAIKILRSAGITVDVLGEVPCTAPEDLTMSVRMAVLNANEALLHRAARRRPLSILKYAMTLDGKIATQQGHSAWVTSPPARAMVFEARARSDAVIVGGNTVRRDNPRLTTRKDTGHMPVRMVMSRTLDLPEDAALWDVTVAPTIVTTQRGARTAFQAKLRSRGVEVVEFDFLTPEAVAEYCYSRGFLQCFWECGGTLAAPCISSSVVHKLLAFVAPKVIGGARAPTPVGELGFVEMTQAVTLCDGYTWQQVGPDLMLTGYLPSSGGPLALSAELDSATSELVTELPTDLPRTNPAAATATTAATVAAAAAAAVTAAVAVTAAAAATAPTAGVVAAPSSSAKAGSGSSGSSGTSSSGGGRQAALLEVASEAQAMAQVGRRPGNAPNATKVVPFYKAWDKWGSLSNFSPHPVQLPYFNSRVQAPEPLCMAALGLNMDMLPPPPQAGSLAQEASEAKLWPTVEHYYQAQKFSGNGHPDASALVHTIAACGSPEEAARAGRSAERSRPELLTPGWQRIKVDVMLGALRAKFSTHSGPRSMLLATCKSPGPGARLVEASPNDFFWGAGYNGGGRNVLGLLLAHVRNELTAAN